MSREKRFAESLKALIATREGRDVLATIIFDRCEALITPFAAHADRREFTLGRHSVGTGLLQDIDALDEFGLAEFLRDVRKDELNDRED